MRFTLDGSSVVLKASAQEIDILTGMLGQFGELVEARSLDPHRGELTPKDPALARLLPDPVYGDPEASAELRSLTEAALISHKLRNAQTVNESLADARIAPAALDAGSEVAWLKILTDLRIVMAVRLGIERDEDAGRSETDAERWMQSAYHWLGAVQSDLLDAIAVRDAARDAG